jgi:hypothetical protein
LGVLETPKKAVPIGTGAGVQLALALKSKVPGTGPATVAGLFQVASCAAAGKAASSNAEEASSAARRARGRPRRRDRASGALAWLDSLAPRGNGRRRLPVIGNRRTRPPCLRVGLARNRFRDWSRPPTYERPPPARNAGRAQPALFWRAVVIMPLLAYKNLGDSDVASPRLRPREFRVAGRAVAAVHESGCGTSETSGDDARRSAHGGNPDIEVRSSKDRV